MIRLLALIAFLLAAPAVAGETRAGGKLALTGGVSTVEGNAGGGLATWSLVTGDETDAGIGASAHVTLVPLPNFTFTSEGVAIGIRDRLELSYARQRFDTRAAGAALGLGHGFTFGQDVYAAKLRVAGDALYAQNSWLPQIAVGVQYKEANQAKVIGLVGGKASKGTDFTVSATKIILAKSLLLDGTLRVTKANQFGLLGFGGDRSNAYHAEFEGSAGLLLSPTLAAGAEYRSKPSNLGFAKEQAAWDLFAAWRPVRHLTLTAAYADLGSIATLKGQHGAFLSLQASY